MTEAEPNQKPPRSQSGPTILQTIIDLHNSNRQATRQVLVEETGLSYDIVDDHVKRMSEQGKIRRVLPGVFEPIDQVEDRAVSVTHMPKGTAKLEIGDLCVELTSRELRMVAMAVGGAALLFAR